MPLPSPHLPKQHLIILYCLIVFHLILYSQSARGWGTGVELKDSTEQTKFSMRV